MTNQDIRLAGCIVVSMLCHGLFSYCLIHKQPLPELPVVSALTATINYVRQESQIEHKLKEIRRGQRQAEKRAGQPVSEVRGAIPVANVGEQSSPTPGESSFANQGEAAPVTKADPVAISFWEDDVEARIRVAGRQHFNREPGAARVSMLISADGTLLDLQISGDAYSMAEAAIKSISSWPRFNSGEEPRRFRRRLAFVVES